MKRKLSRLGVASLATILGIGAAVAAGQGALGGLPDEVKSASIRVPENTETQAELARLARIDKQQAEAAALAVQPGAVTEAALDDEDGYLVWKIAVKHDQRVTEFAVDAGDARVLAAEAEEHDGPAHENDHEDDTDEGPEARG